MLSSLAGGSKPIRQAVGKHRRFEIAAMPVAAAPANLNPAVSLIRSAGYWQSPCRLYYRQTFHVPRFAPGPARQGVNVAADSDREGRLRMAEKLVGKISEFKDGDRRIVFLGDHEIGVFRENGTFYAYSNYCLHQGGPACEGLTIAKVEERIMPDKTSKGLYFSDTELHFVCPWHGYEYDIKTGECVSDRRLKLRKYEVIEKGDEVYVRA
jgi:nitrite reductase/ring-hydroxylating ferredoxin subunit